MILLVGSISLGVVASVIGDNRQRRAFLDTRQSYEMRLTIEDQAREQVSTICFIIITIIITTIIITITSIIITNNIR